MRKGYKIFSISLIVIFTLLLAQSFSFAASGSNVFLQMKTEFKKAKIDSAKFETLLKQAVNILKPVGFQTVATYYASDINKDRIPEVAAAYKKTVNKTVTVKFVIYKWDGSISKYKEAYSKTLTNVTVNVISASNLLYKNNNQFVFAYSIYPNKKGVVIADYTNNKFKEVYSKQTNSFGFSDVDKDKKIELGEITYDKKNTKNAVRVWKKWNGKIFKTIKAEYTTVKKLQDETATENKKILEQIQQQAYAQKAKEAILGLKPEDYNKVDGYLFEDFDNDKVYEVIAVFSKTGTTASDSTTKLGIYRLDKASKKLIEAYDKTEQGIKVVAGLAVDVIYGGNKEGLVVYSDKQNKQNLIILSYNNGTIKEEFTKQADRFYGQDTDNDKKLEIAQVNASTTDLTKEVITWLKWDGTKFATLKEETVAKK